MKKRKWILPVSIVGGVIVLCIVAVFAFGAILSAQGYGISTGRLYFADNGTYLIESDDMAMRVSDCSKDAELFKGYQNGDKVILFHDGVNETYPAQTGGYYIIRTSKGDGTYKPADEVLCIESLPDTEHTHNPSNESQTVDDPVSGYCGNTQTTIYFDNDKSYTFMSGNSVAMTDILVNLKYDKNKLCKCLPEYTVDTEFGTGYGINLTSGYVRCDKGQADLTLEEIDKLKEIILWAKEEVGVSSVSTNHPNYSFSLTWNTYGISSYDSITGTLIKTSDATNPKDYTTNLKLTEQQYSAIWKLIKGLDIESYPDEYNPHGDGSSDPHMTLILSVKADGIDKTITVKETMLSYEANNKKGQKFLDTCKGIQDILTATEEWKALPEYEFLYD